MEWPSKTLFAYLSAAGLMLSATASASEAVEAPWKRSGLDFETGLLWRIRNNTDINYRLLTTQATWRSPAQFEYHFGNDSTLVLRSRVSLIATAILEGPENHYFGFSAAPSFEWWSPDDKWSVFFAVGGGAGVIDSTDVVGGQGQDFTLNWFANLGLRHQINDNFSIHGGILFQHFSNGGATDPNPGLDVLGFSLGAGFSF